MRDHEANRYRVCLLCFSKANKGKKLPNPMKTTIKQHFIPDYNECSAKYPKVLCGSCYRAIYRCDKGEKSKSIRVHSYNKELPPATRNRGLNCDCELCVVARQTLNTCKPASKVSKIMKICRECLSEVGPGKRHVCGKSTLVQNIVQYSGDMKGQVAAAMVKQQFPEEDGSVRLSNVRGKSTRIQLNPEATVM